MNPFSQPKPGIPLVILTSKLASELMELGCPNSSPKSCSAVGQMGSPTTKTEGTEGTGRLRLGRPFGRLAEDLPRLATRAPTKASRPPITNQGLSPTSEPANWSEQPFHNAHERSKKINCEALCFPCSSRLPNSRPAYIYPLICCEQKGTPENFKHLEGESNYSQPNKPWKYTTVPSGTVPYGKTPSFSLQ